MGCKEEREETRPMKERGSLINCTKWQLACNTHVYAARTQAHVRTYARTHASMRNGNVTRVMTML